jgi:hypothetical protein
MQHHRLGCLSVKNAGLLAEGRTSFQESIWYPDHKLIHICGCKIQAVSSDWFLRLSITSRIDLSLSDSYVCSAKSKYLYTSRCDGFCTKWQVPFSCFSSIFASKRIYKMDCSSLVHFVFWMASSQFEGSWNTPSCCKTSPFLLRKGGHCVPHVFRGLLFF